MSCGLKVKAAIAPTSQKINVSGIESQQALNSKRYDTTDVNDILGGHALDETSTKLLSEPKNDLTMAILKILETFLPTPPANITFHPRWKCSVFAEIELNDRHFTTAAQMFAHKWSRMSMACYLE